MWLPAQPVGVTSRYVYMLVLSDPCICNITNTLEETYNCPEVKLHSSGSYAAFSRKWNYGFPEVTCSHCYASLFIAVYINTRRQPTAYETSKEFASYVFPWISILSWWGWRDALSLDRMLWPDARILSATLYTHRTWRAIQLTLVSVMSLYTIWTWKWYRYYPWGTCLHLRPARIERSLRCLDHHGVLTKKLTCLNRYWFTFLRIQRIHNYNTCNLFQWEKYSVYQTCTALDNPNFECNIGSICLL